MPTLRELLPALQSRDVSQPAITCYDRTGGATHGERIELSGRVLLTWASKAGNALQDEWSLEPGSTVGLALPAHWRAGYWALATWWAGATLVTGAGALEADLLVTDDPTLAAEAPGEAALVTLAGLARSHPGPVPAGVMDEARELATYGDRFDALDSPGPGAVAWRRSDGTRLYDDPLRADDRRTCLVVGEEADRHTADLEDALDRMVRGWSGDGSLVLVRTGAPGSGGPGDPGVAGDGLAGVAGIDGIDGIDGIVEAERAELVRGPA
ncbi:MULTISPECIES: TIGR03089 family protein [Arsenicicoccus]|uniref:TIGR03089 family protein n=1 Tax=Arsenicicoccus TaxID=267408 RepID=UPI00257F9239|nr:MULTISPECIES: TIGR03089 family protein [Arsenicicoccus]